MAFKNPFQKGKPAEGASPAEAPTAASAAGPTTQLEAENLQLKRAVEELSILNDLSRAIGASVDSKEIIERIVEKSMRAVSSEQTVVTLVDRETNQSMKTLVRAKSSSAEHPHFHMNDNLIGWMHLYKKPLLTNDPTGDDRFKGLKWDDSIHSLICVPLIVKSELRGVITAYNKKDGEFTENDQRLLAIIASQSAQIIENARLYEEEQKFASMREQVKLASQIQQDLLPESTVPLDGYDIAAKSIPAQEVGGDYYDFIRDDHGHIALCLGDVSGKGLPASLLMANLQATLRSQTLTDSPVAERVTKSNRLMHQSTDPEKFATLFYGVLNPESHSIQFCNAGHEIPFLFDQQGNVTKLETGGVALGVLDEFPYPEDVATVGPGDTLVIYSDGIPDQTNEFDQPFSDKRLIEFVQQNLSLSAEALIDAIIGEVKGHEGDTAQVDDLTLVVVKRSP